MYIENSSDLGEMVKIYKITSCANGRCYIGSTNVTLAERLRAHETATRAGTNTTLSRKIIEGGDYEILLLEECSDAERKEREKFHILRNKRICVNRNTPWTEDDDGWSRKEKNAKTGIVAQTREEYKAQYDKLNTQRRREYNKSYYNENKEKFFVKHECEVCGGSYTFYGRKTHYGTKKHLKALSAAMKEESPVQECPGSPLELEEIQCEMCA